MTIFKKQDYREPPLNTEIFEAIGRGKKVLDVGCGPGKLGQALKQKGCFTVGIEIDDELSRLARPHYDELITCDLEGLTSLKFPKSHFDVIVFADILEHLAHPEKALAFFGEYLADDGYILACIPNVANWQVRLGMLFGKFDYKPGILDGGHLRFFTRRSAGKLIEGAGFRVAWIRSRNRLLGFLGRLMPGLFAFQFIIKAYKK